MVFIYGVVDLSDALKGAQLLPVYEEKKGELCKIRKLCKKSSHLMRIAAWILLQTSPDVFDIFAQTGAEIMNIDPFQTMPAYQTVWASSDS